MATPNEDVIPDPTLTNQVVENAETGAALDAALAELTAEPAAETVTDPEKPADTAPETASEPEATAEPAVDPEPSADPEPPADTPASRVPVAEPAPVEDDPILKALDAVKLRADASQKTKDTFANLKQLSAEGLKAARAELAKVRAEQQKAIEAARQAALEEAKKQVAVPEDVQKELEELRTLRARVDVESDPQFKQRFDARRDSNFETIYGVLKSHSLAESEVKALKAMSVADRIEAITDLAAKLPHSSKLKIDAKLFENLNLDDERQKALEEARAKATEIHSQREQQTKAEQEKAKLAREQAVAQFRSQDVFKKLEIPVSTPPEEKKRLEAANAQAEKLQKLYDEVVNDETPLAKAEAAYGLVLAHKFKADLDATNAKLAAAQKELDAIKKRSGVTDKGRVVNVAPSTKPAIEITDAGSALDAFAKQHGFL